MVFKKLVAIILSALLTLSLAGCEGLMFDADELLSPPKLEGEMYPVQQALNNAVGENITLKYPSQGNYRSAIVMKDVNSDALEEAFAFYSTTADGAVTMHINVMEKVNGAWQSKSDLSLAGSGIESVSFADLNGNGKLEVIVGWYIFGTTEKQVGVYTFDGQLTARAIEPYTNFAYADLTGDQKDDLIIIYLNSSEKQASAKLISLSDQGINETGSVPLDGGVSSYSNPVVSQLSSGQTALYIDAVKGNGTLTEIIWFEDGTLHGIYDANAPESAPTYRNSALASRDFDGNGVIDIPLMEIMKSTDKMSELSKVYYTNWSEFDGKNLKLNVGTLINDTDSYQLYIPQKLADKILLTRQADTRANIFYSYDLEKALVGEEIFKIVALSSAQYNADLYEKNGYIVLDENEGIIYIAKVMPENEFGLKDEDITEMFEVIR